MARQLLRNAGWSPGPDGIMRKDGPALSLVLVTNNSNATRRQASLADASDAARSRHRRGDQVLSRRLLFAPGGHGRDPAAREVRPFGQRLVCRHRPGRQLAVHVPERSPGRLQLLPLLQSARCRRLQTAALTHYERPSIEGGVLRKSNELLARDNPEIFFWWRRQMEPISVDFKGFDPNPVIESWNAWQWSI